MEIATIGLLVIALAWIVQLIYSWKGKRDITVSFILLYMLGVLLLLISGYLATSGISNYEVVTLIAAGLVLLRILTIKKKK